MIRTDARLTTLLTTAMAAALLTACDPGGAPLDEPAELELVEPEPVAVVEPAEELVAQPEWSLEQECETFYFATRENKSYASQCIADVPEQQLPEIFPDWDDLMNDWLDSAASSTCSGLGARNGDGQLPTNNELAIEVDDLVAAGGQAPRNGPGGPTPPVCESVCQSHGKVWNPNAANFGTCAFNLSMLVQPPEHQEFGPACPGPDIRRWSSNGGVLFDCGCVCE